MALIRDFALPGGIVVTGAYFVITSLHADKILLEKAPVAEGEEDTGATRESGGQALGHVGDATPNAGFTVRFVYDPAGALPVVQGYQHLMAQPYFNEATVDIDS